jgi:DNA-binding winged helix-turn-helix (wHTH) protein
LIVYAVAWEWSLDRKLKRIAREGRQIDISDAVHILRILVASTGGIFQRETIKSWNVQMFEPIQDRVLDIVAAEYERLYQTKGIER